MCYYVEYCTGLTRKGKVIVGLRVWEVLDPFLKQVKRNREEILRFQQNQVSDFLDIDYKSPILHFLPALVLIGSCYYGMQKMDSSSNLENLRLNSSGSFDFSCVTYDKSCFRKVIGMSTIFQLVYLSSEIHNQIQDDTGDSKLIAAYDEQSPHFSVLFGDYIYGKLLKQLGEIDCLNYLASLAEVICQMNEGAILRKEITESGNSDRELIENLLNKEFVSLFKEAGKIGVTLTWGALEEADRLGKFAGSLGMILGMVERKFDSYFIKLKYDEALRSLGLLPEGWLRDMAKQLLQEAISYIDQDVLPIASGA